MKVLIVKPGYAPYEAEINGLHEMQDVVCGVRSSSLTAIRNNFAI